MTYKGFVNFIKLDNETILKLSKDKGHKRALLIYAYLSYIGVNTRAVQTDLGKLIELFNLKVTTSSKESLKSSLEILIELELISVYVDKTLTNTKDIDEYTKKPKDTFWVTVKQSDSESHFTLIPVCIVEDIIFTLSKEKPEDMFSVLSYICSKTERRETVSPIMWSGMNRISKDIHMTEKKLMTVLDEMMELNMLYFRRANMSSGRKNYIYGLYSDKEFVDNSIMIAESNNKIDKRVKSRVVSDNVIEVLDGEFLIDIKLSMFFDRHKIECNHGVAKETNRFYQKHGQAKLMEVLGTHNPEIINADNKIGAYRHILKRSY